jgi:hypothetical protein
MANVSWHPVVPSAKHLEMGTMQIIGSNFIACSFSFISPNLQKAQHLAETFVFWLNPLHISRIGQQLRPACQITVTAK